MRHIQAGAEPAGSSRCASLHAVHAAVSGIAAGLVGAAVATVGLVFGRLVPKRDPVGTPCGTCDGPRRVRWDVVPGAGPGSCPECGRTVRGPTLLIVTVVVIWFVSMQVLGDGSWVLAADGVLGGSLAGLVWTDARYRVLPTPLVWGATVASSAVLALADRAAPGSHLPGAAGAALVSGAVFLVLHLISPEGLALGDVRLAVLLGLHLGWRSATATFWGFFLAALAGALVGLASKRLRGDDGTLPFGPFLAGSTAAVLLVSAAAT